MFIFNFISRCIGTGQHLKNRYGSGYLLEVKLRAVTSDVRNVRTERREALVAFANKTFKNINIQESFEDRIIFNIAQDSVTSLSETFQALEAGTIRSDFEQFFM